MIVTTRLRCFTLFLLTVIALAACGGSKTGGLGQGAARRDPGGDGGAPGPTTRPSTTTTTPADTAARDLAVQVLSRVLGDRPRAEVQSFPDFGRYVDLARNGGTYDQLLQQATRDYVTQAYDSIFKSRNDSGQSPTGRTGVGFNEAVFQQVYNVVRAAGARGNLQLPDGRTKPADADGIWSFVAESAPVWGAVKTDHANGESCVGGIGPRCKGAGVIVGADYVSNTPRPFGVDAFQRMDGLPMMYIQMAVAVGSILHDRSCADASHMYVVYCSGENFPDPGTEANILGGAAGGREWRKAVNNATDQRFWTYKFGPYPMDGSRDPAASPVNTSGMIPNSPADFYSDDIRLVQPNRPTMVASNPFSGLDTVYTAGEYQATTVLFAPPTKSVDTSDRMYCFGQNFARQDSTPFTAWGVCS